MAIITLLKLVLLVGALAIGALVHWRRQVKGRSILEGLDSGKICVRCDGTDTLVADDRATCQTCGWVTSLAALRASEVDDRTLVEATSLHEGDPWSRH